MGSARTTTEASTLTLDTGALIALERGQGRMVALARRAATRNCRFHVPAGVLAQAWRSGPRHAALARFMKLREVEVVVLDEARARACGDLCAARATHDVIDASVVLCAREHGDTVVTGDADDLTLLSPSLSVLRI